MGNDVGEVLLAVIDRRGAQLRNGRAFVGAAGGGESLDAEFAAQHQRGRTDAAGAAVDQHALAGVRIAEAEQVGPHSEEGFRYGGGLNPVHALGDRQSLASGHRAKLRITAAIGQGAHLVAQAERGHAVAQRHHFTGHFQTRNRAHAGLHRVFARTLQGVGAIHPGGVHADQDLAGTGHGHLRLARLEHLWATGRGDFDQGHVVREHHLKLPAAMSVWGGTASGGRRFSKSMTSSSARATTIAPAAIMNNSACWPPLALNRAE